ncbi:MAG: hypothetical protein AB1626_04115 [Candidatus Micrarchaeota archaeon]
MEEELVSEAAGAERPANRPQFTVKKAGQEGYVGSAWKKQGKYGPYISVALKADVPKDSALFITPTKANPGIIG